MWNLRYMSDREELTEQPYYKFYLFILSNMHVLMCLYLADVWVLVSLGSHLV